MSHKDESEQVRLNKYIAQCGICSRRDADKIIEEGRVSVNGQPALAGTKVNPGDVVKIDGQENKASYRIPRYMHIISLKELYVLSVMLMRSVQLLQRSKLLSRSTTQDDWMLIQADCLFYPMMENSSIE